MRPTAVPGVHQVGLECSTGTKGVRAIPTPNNNAIEVSPPLVRKKEKEGAAHQRPGATKDTRQTTLSCQAVVR